MNQLEPQAIVEPPSRVGGGRSQVEAAATQIESASLGVANESRANGTPTILRFDVKLDQVERLRRNRKFEPRAQTDTVH